MQAEATSGPTSSAQTGQIDIAAVLAAFIEKQEKLNANMQSAQQQLLSFVSTIPLGEYNDDYKQQMYTARYSRPSVIAHNTLSVSSDNNSMQSPIRPPAVRRLTKDEEARRASHGNPLFTPIADPNQEANAEVPADRAPQLPIIDRGRNTPYGQAHQAISKMDKYYGDKKYDKDIDVHSFVRSVDFELGCWMKAEMNGRLELVISATSGVARDWLLHKREDLQYLVTCGRLRPENAEWASVKDEFIQRMGGGQTEKIYQTKLRDLRMGNRGSDDVMKFTTTFREYATRAYPLYKYPDTVVRSLMLGGIFNDSVCASDFGVWQETQRRSPAPETLEDWEVALAAAWSSEQIVREQRRRIFGDHKKSYPPSNTAKVNHMQTENNTSEWDGTSTGSSEGLNVASTPNGKSQAPKKFNKYIDGKMAAQLIRLSRCLHCYKGDHFADKCPKPAPRAPTEQELKEKAGQ